MTPTQRHPEPVPTDTLEAEWLTPRQVCELMPGMTPALLERLRRARRGPRFMKPTPRRVMYARADIDEWMRQSTVTTRDQR